MTIAIYVYPELDAAVGIICRHSRVSKSAFIRYAVHTTIERMLKSKQLSADSIGHIIRINDADLIRDHFGVEVEEMCNRDS